MSIVWIWLQWRRGKVQLLQRHRCIFSSSDFLQSQYSALHVHWIWTWIVTCQHSSRSENADSKDMNNPENSSRDICQKTHSWVASGWDLPPGPSHFGLWSWLPRYMSIWSGSGDNYCGVSPKSQKWGEAPTTYKSSVLNSLYELGQNLYPVWVSNSYPLVSFQLWYSDPVQTIHLSPSL